MINKVNENREKKVNAAHDRYIHKFEKKIDKKVQSLFDQYYKSKKSYTAPHVRDALDLAMNREMNEEFTTIITKEEKE